MKPNKNGGHYEKKITASNTTASKKTSTSSTSTNTIDGSAGYSSIFVKEAEIQNIGLEETLEAMIDNVLSTILKRFWWPTVASDVRRYCNQFNLVGKTLQKQLCLESTLW